MSVDTSFEKCRTFIDCQMQPGGKTVRIPTKLGARPLVTFSRQTGSGGTIVLEKLRSYLQERDPSGPGPWTIFDKNLVSSVLEDHHLPGQLANYMPEDKVSSISDMMEEVLGLHPSSWSLVRNTTETMIHLAELGRVILVGRAANLITRKFEKALHVRLVGSFERRVAQVQEARMLSRKAAGALVRKEDEGRRRYVRKYFKADIDDPLLYHFVINTDFVAYDEAVRIIGEAVLRRAREEG